jgi:hypothetical protein
MKIDLTRRSVCGVQITESDPAFAVFGSDSTSGIQRFGVKVVKQVNSLHIGVLVNPRTPSRPCWADTLRTPAVMIGKGGSVYRTGRLGTKMLEYLGPDLKKTMVRLHVFLSRAPAPHSAAPCLDAGQELSPQVRGG